MAIPLHKMKLIIQAEISKLDNCDTYKEVNELLYEVLEYYKQLSKEKWEKNQRRVIERKEKYGVKNNDGFNEQKRKITA